MITSTSLSHPTMMRKIIRAIKETKETGFPVYVQNKKGVAIMRVRFDIHTKTVDFYAGNRNMGMVVKEAFSLFRKVHVPRKQRDKMEIIRDEMTEVFLFYVRSFNSRIPNYNAPTGRLISIRNHLIHNAVLKHQRDRIIDNDLGSLYKNSVLIRITRDIAASIGVQRLFSEEFAG